MPQRAARGRALASLLALLAGALLSGCGHPASEAECHEMIDRMMRLEAQEQGSNLSAEDLDKKVAEAKEDLTKDCVGKRITSGALDCVRNASTASEIREDCFN